MNHILKNCLTCTKEFTAHLNDIKRGYGKFCSHSCSSIYAGKNKIKPISNVICALCKTDFYLSKSKKKRSKSGLYFCCRAHKDEAQCIGGIKEIMPPHYGNTLQDYRVVAFVINKKTKQCERCGYNAHEACIVVHHKDRDRKNNNITNLEILCANCHAIEHNKVIMD